MRTEEKALRDDSGSCRAMWASTSAEMTSMRFERTDKYADIGFLMKSSFRETNWFMAAEKTTTQHALDVSEYKTSITIDSNGISMSALR
jgi:hypothetical protein